MISGPKSTWEEQAEAIVQQGYPAMSDRLPDLMEWLQDGNWPGAGTIARFLASIGRPVVPHVKQVLRGPDPQWRLYILLGLVRHWPRELVAEIEPELSRVMHADTFEGDDIAAIRLLVDHHLGDEQRIRKIVELKIRRCQSDLEEFDKIKAAMESSQASGGSASGT